MAAKIQFSNGLEATLLDEEGTWICADKDKEDTIRLLSLLHLQKHGLYYVTPIESLARAVAEIFKAKLIHADPEPSGASGDLETAWRMREAKARGIAPELLEWGKEGAL